jgi:hypothetical protein
MAFYSSSYASTCSMLSNCLYDEHGIKQNTCTTMTFERH